MKKFKTMLAVFNNRCHFIPSPSLTRTLLSLLALVALTSPASAFDKLTEAQAWIYDRSHLHNTTQGQILIYDYTSSNDDTESVKDQATLTIMNTHPENRRDVKLGFLTSERRMPLPDFNAYRGNPIIIVMLEHIAQDMNAITDGGTLYFRNRIRSALASDTIAVSGKTVTYNSIAYPATTLSFKPFLNDPYISNFELISDAEFELTISDAIPGGLFNLSVTAEHDGASYSKHLTLQ